VDQVELFAGSSDGVLHLEMLVDIGCEWGQKEARGKVKE